MSTSTFVRTARTEAPLEPDRHSAVDRVTVWILEDSDVYRRTVQEVVNGTDDLHCPSTFGTTEELLAFMVDHFAPEVMLVDIGLPGLDGIEAVRRVQGFSPATQLVMLTIHEDNDRVFDALCSGATGYMLKNTPLEEILGAIREVRRGGVPMSPEIARRILNLFRHIRSPRGDYQLTVRERDVLNQLVAGRSKKQIAAALTLSRHTIDTHMRNIYAKLHVHSGKSAVAKALQEKLV